MNKLLLKRVSFFNSRVKRNTEVAEAGLFTQHMKMEKGEIDVDFVNRFLISILNGRKRACPQYKKFVLTIEEGDNYITIWGVK
jgi:hypothetical protein